MLKTCFYTWQSQIITNAGNHVHESVLHTINTYSNKLFIYDTVSVITRQLMGVMGRMVISNG